jgi:hypothetical protein
MTDPISRDIPAAKAVFDTHADVRKKIEIACNAVHDALVAMVAYKDPMAPVVFDADWETLELLASTSRSKLAQIFMTGVPTFKLRMTDEVFRSLLKDEGDPDALLRMLLQSFPVALPISSL